MCVSGLFCPPRPRRAPRQLGWKAQQQLRGAGEARGAPPGGGGEGERKWLPPRTMTQAMRRRGRDPFPPPAKAQEWRRRRSRVCADRAQQQQQRVRQSRGEARKVGRRGGREGEAAPDRRVPPTDRPEDTAAPFRGENQAGTAAPCSASWVATGGKAGGGEARFPGPFGLGETLSSPSHPLLGPPPLQVDGAHPSQAKKSRGAHFSQDDPRSCCCPEGIPISGSTRAHPPPK